MIDIYISCIYISLRNCPTLLPSPTFPFPIIRNSSFFNLPFPIPSSSRFFVLRRSHLLSSLYEFVCMSLSIRLYRSAYLPSILSSLHRVLLPSLFPLFLILFPVSLASSSYSSFMFCFFFSSCSSLSLFIHIHHFTHISRFLSFAAQIFLFLRVFTPSFLFICQFPLFTSFHFIARPLAITNILISYLFVSHISRFVTPRLPCFWTSDGF